MKIIPALIVLLSACILRSAFAVSSASYAVLGRTDAITVFRINADCWDKPRSMQGVCVVNSLEKFRGLEELVCIHRETTHSAKLWQVPALHGERMRVTLRESKAA